MPGASSGGALARRTLSTSSHVLICGSKSLPEHLVTSLEPWELKHLEPFRAEFLSGFKTERYAVGLAEGFAHARAIMDAEIRRLCERDIGGNHQRLMEVNTQHVGKSLFN